MIPKKLEAKILRLYHVEKWRVGTLARQLGVHHSTVRRVLAQAGIVMPTNQSRPSMADPYMPFIIETLRKYPTLTAIRLYEMVRERGYPGGPDHFRSVVARHRPRKTAEAYLRLRTFPGEQAQVDWGSFGTMTIGRAVRRLSAFVMALSWSRRLFLQFFLDQQMSNFLRGHEAAFDAFGGVPRVLLYDNLKSAVLERQGAAIRFNPTLLDFAGHYRFEPRPVAPGRGNEKGRVERAIYDVRRSFLPARTWRGLDDLNAQAKAWCEGRWSDRPCPEDRAMSVAEAFEQERPQLLALPDTPFPTDERKEVCVGKTPYVRFDLNDYSVPHTYARRLLVVVANPTAVRVLDGDTVIATHPRSFDKGAQVEESRHIEDLVASKREGRRHRGMNRLYHAAPLTQELLARLGTRGDNLGSATAALIRMLDRHGAQALNQAVAEVLEGDTAHPRAVQQVLERKRREKGVPPPIPVQLPDDTRVRNLSVRPHDLKTYDSLKENYDDTGK